MNGSQARLPGKWFYERAVCDCGCTIITAGRKQLQRGEELFCENDNRMVRAVRIETATLVQQDALCKSDSEYPASAVANEPTLIANG